jgi:nucleolar protein 56
MRLLELAKASVTSAYSTGEHSLILAITTYNEMERTRNLIHEKLEEWYGIFFPELRVTNPITYAKFVVQHGRNKREATKEQLNEMFGATSQEVMQRIEKSIGREPSEEEYTMMKNVADAELYIAEQQNRLDRYLEAKTKELMPNISYLIDYKIAAELLSKAGSLSKLAMMPASTIQLLGAEKALFKHIKFHSKPPKYGVLFKLPQISNGPRFQRGRIARIYATKICIAAKADAFTKNFIAPRLKEQLDKAMAMQAKAPEPKNKRFDSHEGQYRGGNRPQRFRPRGEHGPRR